MMRRSRDQMLMMMAEAASGRSTCSRLHVGAVVAVDGRVVSTGYNGAPAGLPHCDHEHEVTGALGREHCLTAVHAEANAIVFAARHGAGINHAELFTTASPCPGCANLIINAGITRVVFMALYNNAVGGLDRLDQAGITTMHLGYVGS
jgi:dCMP deaminase